MPSVKYSIISREKFELVLGVELWSTWHLRYLFYLQGTDMRVAENLGSIMRGLSIMMPVELYYSLTPTCSLFLVIDAGSCLHKTMVDDGCEYLEHSEYGLFSPHVFNVGLRCKIR